ncbi:hypothetical protein OUZ56_033928 [Daphnia magna]|uniref:Uncharacterized protein n=2 Tax=Daphnia TaxID=6668 RepID=A0ABR0BBE1_9CRUS|nr:hypothetical protein OUZ56_033928 [Daphnia magna]
MSDVCLRPGGAALNQGCCVSRSGSPGVKARLSSRSDNIAGVVAGGSRCIGSRGVSFSSSSGFAPSRGDRSRSVDAVRSTQSIVRGALHRVSRAAGNVYFEQIRVLKAGVSQRLNIAAWNDGIGPRSDFAGLFFWTREVRRRSDTALVLTINDANQQSVGVTPMTRRAASGKPKSLGSGGSMVAKLKLKGIDGRAPPGVEPAA